MEVGPRAEIGALVEQRNRIRRRHQRLGPLLEILWTSDDFRTARREDFFRGPSHFGTRKPARI
jgi:hypothetical protein